MNVPGLSAANAAGVRPDSGSGCDRTTRTDRPVPGRSGTVGIPSLPRRQATGWLGISRTWSCVEQGHPPLVWSDLGPGQTSSPPLFVLVRSSPSVSDVVARTDRGLEVHLQLSPTMDWFGLRFGAHRSSARRRLPGRGDKSAGAGIPQFRRGTSSGAAVERAGSPRPGGPAGRSGPDHPMAELLTRRSGSATVGDRTRWSGSFGGAPK